MTFRQLACCTACLTSLVFPATHALAAIFTRHRLRSASTQPPGTPVPLHHSPSDRHQALVGGSSRPGRAPLQAAVSRWVDTYCIGAVRFYVQDERYAAGAGMRKSGHGETRRTGAAPETQPDSFPRGIRTQLQTPRPHRAAAAPAHRCRSTAGPDGLAAPAHPCAPRHRDFLSNGCSASGASLPSTSRPARLLAAHSE